MKKKVLVSPDPSVLVRKNKQGTQAEKFLRLCESIEEIRRNGLTGHIKVNFNQGNICKVEKYEEILKD